MYKSWIEGPGVVVGSENPVTAGSRTFLGNRTDPCWVSPPEIAVDSAGCTFLMLAVTSAA